MARTTVPTLAPPSRITVTCLAAPQRVTLAVIAESQRLVVPTLIDVQLPSGALVLQQGGFLRTQAGGKILIRGAS